MKTSSWGKVLALWLLELAVMFVVILAVIYMLDWHKSMVGSDGWRVATATPGPTLQRQLSRWKLVASSMVTPTDKSDLEFWYEDALVRNVYTEFEEGTWTMTLPGWMRVDKDGTLSFRVEPLGKQVTISSKGFGVMHEIRLEGDGVPYILTHLSDGIIVGTRYRHNDGFMWATIVRWEKDNHWEYLCPVKECQGR